MGISVLVWALASVAVRGPGGNIDRTLAQQYLEEAREQSEQDGGALWGIPLYGPTLFVDPSTRQIVANQADRRGRLEARDGLFVGVLPDFETVANTAKTWAGVEWTMVMWPLAGDREARCRLLLHEMFHRIQDELGLPGSNPLNAHFDTKDGRILARLEWRSLAMAVGTQPDERELAIQDALTFRMRRRQLFANAADEERALEMNEGLAEYTGAVLAGFSDEGLVEWTQSKLRQQEQKQTYARSFAYAVGPAYGLLLDEAAPDWRNGLTPEQDLGEMLREAWGIKLDENLAEAVELCLSDYDGEAVIVSEEARAEQRQRRMERHRARYLTGPVMRISLSGAMRYSFDPNNVEAFDDDRAVYPTVRVTDRWGVLDVDGGAMLCRDSSGAVTEVRLPAPANPQESPVIGDGWTLTLKAGWSLAAAEKEGDLQLVNAGDR